jgi:hypothetical protein
METNKPNNPQAFPQEWTMNGTTDNWENGMSLRDYFASKAIANLSVSIRPKTLYDRFKLFLRNFGFENEVNYERQYDNDSDAEYCYLLADAMLKIRD